jgi:hypothetical protein
MGKLKIPGRMKMTLPWRMDGKGGEAEATGDHGRWWAEEDEDKARSIALGCFRQLAAQMGNIHFRSALHTALYEGEEPPWLGALLPSASPLFYSSSSPRSNGTRARANLIRRCIDTGVATVGKNVVEVRCVTNGGSWRLQKKARQRTKFINGSLREMCFHEAQMRGMVDGMTTRTGGMIKGIIDFENETIKCKRVHPKSFVWNEAEGPEIRTLYERTPTTRDEVLARYPDQKSWIMKAKNSESLTSIRGAKPNAQLADMIDVTECYHLGTSDKNPGRMLVVLENCTLADEEWTFPGFPYARFCWDRADEGWQCRPASESLIGYHDAIGRTMRRIDKAQGLMCVPRVWLEENSDVEEDNLTNEVGGVGHHRGSPPTFSTAPAMPPEVYRWLDWLFEQGMADLGFNGMQTQGLKPAGLDAGVALREYNDIANTRQVPKGQQLERQTEYMGDLIMYLGAKLAEKVPSFAITALGAGSYERIKFSEVNEDSRDIRISSNPVSALPSTTPGKIQTITDLIKGGLLPPEEIQGGLGLKLLNFPDLEKVITMETAMRDIAEMQVDLALYEGKYLAPEPYQSAAGLKILKTLSARAYFQALMLDGVPERNMDMIRRLMSESDLLEQRLSGGPSIGQPVAAVPPPATAPLEQSPMAPPPIPGGGVPAPMAPNPGVVQ